MNSLFKSVVLTIVLSIVSVVSAQAALHNIHIEWTYDAALNPDLAGFRLYQDNTDICHIADPTARAMDCSFESDYGTFDFYLAAYNNDLSESPLSTPFPFTLTGPPVASVAASQITLDESLLLELTPGNLQGDISSCTWSFSDGTPDITNQGDTITHAFPANKVSTYTLTVTDSTGQQHTTNMSTIIFLKQIHGIVIYHINSFLLKKDKE